MSIKRKNIWTLVVIVTVIAAGFAGYYIAKENDKNIDTSIEIRNFRDCVAAGYPVSESFPEQCRANGEVYTNHIN